eukprot:m.185682 g.185682  ORF g.185682 m.185682 type:complete len:216 (-) comp14735_c0_seq5:897-1544(-)
MAMAPVTQDTEVERRWFVRMDAAMTEQYHADPSVLNAAADAPIKWKKNEARTDTYLVVHDDAGVKFRGDATLYEVKLRTGAAGVYCAWEKLAEWLTLDQVRGVLARAGMAQPKAPLVHVSVAKHRTKGKLGVPGSKVTLEETKILITKVTVDGKDVPVPEEMRGPWLSVCIEHTLARVQANEQYVPEAYPCLRAQDVHHLDYPAWLSTIAKHITQ